MGFFFTSALALPTAAQSFDYADRPQYADESRVDVARGQARAEVSSYEDSVREVPRQLTERRSYAHQTLGFDSVALVTAGAAASGAPELWAIAGPTYLLGPPIVHCAHGRPLAGFASLVLRSSAPILGGKFISSREHDDCPSGETCGLFSDGFVAGFFVGAGIAMLVDAVLLADEEVVVSTTRHLPSR